MVFALHLSPFFYFPQKRVADVHPSKKGAAVRYLPAHAPPSPPTVILNRHVPALVKPSEDGWSTGAFAENRCTRGTRRLLRHRGDSEGIFTFIQGIDPLRGIESDARLCACFNHHHKMFRYV